MGKEGRVDREDPQQPSAQQCCLDWASCKAVFLLSISSPSVNEMPTFPHLVLMKTQLFTFSFLLLNSFLNLNSTN